MSSATNEAEMNSSGQLPGNSNAADQNALGASEDYNGRSEVVEGLERVPVPLTSTWLADDEANEYVQLCDAMYNDDDTEFECGLPLLLKEFGDPLANSINYCDCDVEEAHTCWLTSEFCGTRGKHGRRRRKLVDALREAISALEEGLLIMYRRSTIRNTSPQGSLLQAARLTPGLHKVATMRLGSLTHAVERLRAFHKPSTDTSPEDLESSSSNSDDDTDHDGSDEDNSNGSDEDLVGLERRLLACKTDLLKPLREVDNTKESIVKASEDLKLAVRTYDNAGKGPRSAVRGYYKACVLQVADAMPSLEHYSEHRHCGGLDYDLREIDDGYRKARDDLYRFYNSAEVSDGLEKILWSIWDETRSHFEDVYTLVERPESLCWDSDHELSCSEDSELGSQEDDDEHPEHD